MMTMSELVSCAAGLEEHDWFGFAAAVAKIDPVLGEVEYLHAEAADGNSPSVTEWPRYAMEEAEVLEREGIDSVEAARAYFERRYSI
jgi:hypothetical protein